MSSKSAAKNKKKKSLSLPIPTKQNNFSSKPGTNTNFYKDYFASESLFWEAWIAAKEHKFDKALDKAAEYRTALEEMDDSKRLKYHIALLGHIAMSQGETRSAFELFKNASIDDPFFHYLTARAKDKSGDKEVAAKYFRRAANWNTDSLHYALIRQKALARKVMLTSTDAQ